MVDGFREIIGLSVSLFLFMMSQKCVRWPFEYLFIFATNRFPISSVFKDNTFPNKRQSGYISQCFQFLFKHKKNGENTQRKMKKKKKSVFFRELSLPIISIMLSKTLVNVIKYIREKKAYQEV